MTFDAGVSIACHLAATALVLGALPTQASAGCSLRHDLLTSGVSRDWPTAERVADGWLWTVEPGAPRFLPIAYEGVEAAEWDEVSVRLRVDDPGLTSLGLKLVDAPLGDGMELWFPAPDALRQPTDEPVELRAALREPAALWGQRPDPTSQWVCLRAESIAPVRILLCGARFERGPVRVTADLAEYVAPDRLHAKVRLSNLTDEPLRVRIGGVPAPLRLDARGEAAVNVSLSVGAKSRAPLDRVSAPLKLTYEGRSVKRQETEAALEGIAPLPVREHPYLFADREDLDQAKVLAETEDWAREHIASTIARADEALAGDLTIPQSYGQWGHWYACSKCERAPPATGARPPPAGRCTRATRTIRSTPDSSTTSWRTASWTWDSPTNGPVTNVTPRPWSAFSCSTPTRTSPTSSRNTTSMGTRHAPAPA